MFLFLHELPEIIGYGIVALVVGLVGFLGWKSSGLIYRLRHKRVTKKIEVEHTKMQKGMKQIWDDEKEMFKREKQGLLDEVELLRNKVEDYRRKLAGMGSLNFFSKKRSDILYSLLLENETLEQLLGKQTQKLNDQNEMHLQEKLIEIRKRQRLLSEIFNDEKIKGYVKEIIDEKVEGEATEIAGKDEQLLTNEDQTEEEDQNSSSSS